MRGILRVSCASDGPADSKTANAMATLTPNPLMISQASLPAGILDAGHQFVPYLPWAYLRVIPGAPKDKRPTEAGGAFAFARRVHRAASFARYILSAVCSE